MKNFWKIEGAGNDFMLFEVNPDSPDGAELVKKIPELCHPHTGVAADGIVFTWTDGKQRNWRFFNSDASETNVCGNAARALAMWLASTSEKNQSQWQWTGKLGLFQAKRDLEGQMEVSWPQKGFAVKEVPPTILESLSSGLNDFGLAGVFHIDVGVPHLVMLNHEVWNLEQRLALSSTLRSHPELGPEGANITWISLKTQEAVTFERGVETETLACGSGALAAFEALGELLKSSGAQAPTQKSFKFPGGALTVRREGTQLWLGGPARLVFKGELC